MSDIQFVPPASLSCPRCGTIATWHPPARRTASGGWEADFSCVNGHRLQIFSKAKRPADPVA